MGWWAISCALAWCLLGWTLIRQSPVSAMMIRAMTLANILVPSAGAVAFFVHMGSDSSLWMRLVGIGSLVIGLPILAQMHAGTVIHGLGMGGNLGLLTRTEFVRLFTGRAAMVCVPPGAALVILGLAGTVWADREQPSYALSALLALVLLTRWLPWIWQMLVQLGIPGKLGGFRNREWLHELHRVAEEAGVECKEVMIARTNRTAVAGAFSLGGGVVAITDSLLSALSLSEFLAVMAHEFAHFRHRRQTMAVLVIGFGGTFLLGLILPQLPIPAPPAARTMMEASLSLLSAALSFRWLVRVKGSQEDEADELAVAIVGAKPLAAALTKAYLMNGIAMPERRTLKYRPLRDRLSRIARLGGVSQAELRRIVTGAKEELALWPMMSSQDLVDPLRIQVAS